MFDGHVKDNDRGELIHLDDIRMVVINPAAHESSEVVMMDNRRIEISYVTALEIMRLRKKYLEKTT